LLVVLLLLAQLLLSQLLLHGQLSQLLLAQLLLVGQLTYTLVRTIQVLLSAHTILLSAYQEKSEKLMLQTESKDGSTIYCMNLIVEFKPIKTIFLVTKKF
jgi:hypothetical protein